MELDITLLEQAGFTPFHAEWIDHGVSEINGLTYRSKYQYHTFSDGTNNLTVRWDIEREFSDGTKERFNYDSVADNSTIVNKFGEIIEPDSIDAWGTEMDYMRILFSAYGPGLSNKNILESYQTNLFNRGAFLYPKNKQLN